MKKIIKGQKLEDFIKRLKPFSVQAGFFENSTYNSGLPVAKVAKWQNEGYTVNVTEKMRKFFLAKGAPLKKSTTQIVVPARNFMTRARGKVRSAEGMNVINKLMLAVVNGSMTIEQMCEQLGLYGQGLIQGEIRNTTNPPLSDLTIQWRAQQYASKAKKNKNTGVTSANRDPLRDTGTMLASVSYKVNKNGS